MKPETLEYILLVGITLVASIVLYIILRKLLTIFIKNYATKLNTDPTNFSLSKTQLALLFLQQPLHLFFIKYPIFDQSEQRFLPVPVLSL
jgi:hypothetical protein